MNKLFKNRASILENFKLKAEQIECLSKTLLKKSTSLEEWLEIWK
jgi:hypothetical protein